MDLNRRNILCVLLILVLWNTCLITKASSYHYSGTEGECDGWTYTISSDGVVLDGYEYEIEDETFVIPSTVDGYDVKIINDLYLESSDVENLVIEEGIESIEGLNGYLPYLQSIEIPSSVSEIIVDESSFLFEDSTDWESIDVDEDNPYYETIDGVLYGKQCLELYRVPVGRTGSYEVFEEYSIDDYAFAYSQIEHVTCPSSEYSIGHHAFYECDQLESIKFNDSLYYIGEYAFYRCEALEKVYIEGSIDEIGGCAFEECESLEEIYLNAPVKDLEYNVFRDCSNVTTLTIGYKVPTILTNWFVSFDKLRNITIDPRNVNYCYENGALYDSGKAYLISILDKTISNYVMPSSVKYIVDYAIYNCRNLESVQCSAVLEKITDGNFEECENITFLQLPINLKMIGCYFGDLKNLKKLSIPESVNYIVEYAFNDFEGDVYVVENSYAHNFVQKLDCKFVLTKDVAPGQNNNSNSNATNNTSNPNNQITQGNTVNQGVSTIDEKYAFVPAGYIVEKIIDKEIIKKKGKIKKGTVLSSKTNKYKVLNAKKKTVSYIGPKKKKTNIVIPNYIMIRKKKYKVVQIADGAVKNNKYVKKVTIGNQVQKIGKKAFYGCTKLEEVYMGKNIKQISSYAFYNCKALSRLVMNSSKIKSVGSKSFYYTKKGLQARVPDNKMGEYKKKFEPAIKGV